MKRSFTLTHAHVLAAGGPSLMSEVADYTGSENEAASILRGLERFGSDPSIGYYEMTPKSIQRAYRGAPAVVWSVRAVRR